MPGEHPLTWLDVFTSERLAGNQLAVVHHADDLDDATMQAFARETRLSETTFVQKPTLDGADYRNRIWMMRHELPFAGHPSLGTAIAVALARSETAVRYVQQTGAGLQPIDVEVLGDGLARASMLQEPAIFGPEADRAQVAAAAGLEVADLHPDLPPQVVAPGLPTLVTPVVAGALGRAAPDGRLLPELLEPAGAETFYLVEADPEAGTARTRSFFMDPGGVTEDPATGSAAGLLLAYLRERSGLERVTVAQGVEMGRPSRIECSFDPAAPDRVRVAGNAVVVATGTVIL